MNRGRIQAQGDGCQKSESWNQNNVPTKKDGAKKATSLKSRLTLREQNERSECFVRLLKFIRDAPANGYDVCPSKSFTKYPPMRGIRVDVEIRKGRAFQDD